MQVQFMQPRKVGDFIYKKGIFTVPDEMRKDWFFKQLLELGEALILVDAKVVGEPGLKVSTAKTALAASVAKSKKSAKSSITDES